MTNDRGMLDGNDGTGSFAPTAIFAEISHNWVHADHMGTPILITDATGIAIAQPGGYTTPAFPGQSRTLYDLYYNRYRDYDPTTGRYIQADPIGLAGGQSPYSYAMGNPLRYMDPTGEFVPIVLCGIGAVANVAATGIAQYLANDFDGSDLAVSAGVGCVVGIVAPVAGPGIGGAAALGGISSVAQYGLSSWFNGCRPSVRGVLTNAAVGTLLGGALGRGPGPQEYVSDFWKEPFKGYNRQLNGEPYVRAAVDGLNGVPTAGVAGALTDWLNQ